MLCVFQCLDIFLVIKQGLAVLAVVGSGLGVVLIFCTIPFSLPVQMYRMGTNPQGSHWRQLPY